MSLESEEVQSVLVPEDVVAIRLSYNSEEYRQFGAIYTNVTSPSIFCFARGGIPIEIITGFMEPTALKSKLESAINHNRGVDTAGTENFPIAVGGQPSPSVSSVEPVPSTSRNINSITSDVPDCTRSEKVLTQTHLQSSETQRSNASSTQQNSPAAQHASSTPHQTSSAAGQASFSPQQPSSVQQASRDIQPASSLEERIERAKRMAAAKQQQRKTEEAEEAKQHETERRETGKKLAELRRSQEEDEAKKVAEERRKDKREEAALRQRLREQIAQDRVDRESRMKPAPPKTPSSPNLRTESQNGDSSSSFSAIPGPSGNMDSGLVRLQFRLQDGTSHTKTFEKSVTVGEVRDYAAHNVQVPSGEWSLWTAFPRREFGSRDYSLSLQDLGLISSSVLLVISTTGKENRILARRNGILPLFVNTAWSTFSAVVLVILTPLTFVWKLLIGGGNQNSSESSPAPPRAPRSSGNVLGGGQVPFRNRSNIGRAEGNVHRLHTQDSDDDEQGTYNGNSTQQM